MTDASGILVVAEADETDAAPLTCELLGLARRLAETEGGAVTVALLGDGVADRAPALIAAGADRVIVVDDPALAPCQAETWLPDLVAIIADTTPSLVLVGHSAAGADIGPRLAFRLGTTVATSCIAAAYDDDRLLLTRPCHGGNARETVSIRTTPAVATIKAKSQDPLPADDTRNGDIATRPSVLDAGSVRTQIRGREKLAEDGVRLESAAVVVAGGRGLNGPEGFARAEELAALLNGAVGASRVACDLGWRPRSAQIGLSGRTVAPELYFALGISGAGQHMAGCAAARNIVAVNSDPEAAIFHSARFGVVGDCAEVLPALVAEIGRIRSGGA